VWVAVGKWSGRLGNGAVFEQVCWCGGLCCFLLWSRLGWGGGDGVGVRLGLVVFWRIVIRGLPGGIRVVCGLTGGGGRGPVSWGGQGGWGGLGELLWGRGWGGGGPNVVVTPAVGGCLFECGLRGLGCWVERWGGVWGGLWVLGGLVGRAKNGGRRPGFCWELFFCVGGAKVGRRCDWVVVWAGAWWLLLWVVGCTPMCSPRVGCVVGVLFFMVDVLVFCGFWPSVFCARWVLCFVGRGGP